MKNDERAVVFVAVGALCTPPTEAVDAPQAQATTDLAVLDLDMPGTDGLSGVEAFLSQCPDARLVIVSGTCDKKMIREALQKGAPGFAPKLSGRQIALSALRFLLDEGTRMPSELILAGGTSADADIPSRPATPVLSAKAAAKGLTNRQIDVLRELLKGNSNKQICRNLNLAMGTVKAHVAAVLAALDVSSRTEAIAAAHRLGLHQLIEQQR